jgi:hypothetical protein
MPDATTQRRYRPLYIALAVGTYTLVCAVLLLRILHLTGGHFLFALDDPYIHLALAQQIAAGHYGINPGQAASPSSSILWPFLLAPFAHVRWMPLSALALNLLSGLAAAALLGSAVADWRANDATPRPRTDTLRRVLAVLGLLFIGNLAGLTFIGMEHTLQVLLAVLCALGLIAALRGQPMPRWAIAAAILAPLVRYEDLTLTLAVAVCLIGQRRPRLAAAIFAAACAPLAAFSLFLHHLGLPLLPVSVLFKGGVPIASGSLVHRLVTTVKVRIQYTTDWPDRLILLGLALLLTELALTTRESSSASDSEALRVRRFALGGAALAAFAHFLLGPFGWFHRYEVYIVLFSALIALAALEQRPRMLLSVYAAGLLVCAWPALITTLHTPDGAQEIYQQQFQMHRFITQFATGNVAVNDLGLVAYDRRPGQTVLDLVGLGSLESAKELHKDAAWLDRITRQNDTALVMIYRTPWLFPDIPSTWTPLGTLCETHPPITAADACVTYFATALTDTARQQAAFAAFTQTLPPGILLKPASP